jgi:mannosyltransferase
MTTLQAMATIASRPPWGLRARAVASAPVAIVLGLGGLLALSIYLRTRELDVGFWIDEGLSVGIADRPLTDIPGVLRQDGSPPLYYMVLHVWMAVFGRTEEATHALSVVCAVGTIPLCFWAARSLFGERAGWVAAALAALNPFITQYSQETRMYALTMVLAVLACFAFLRAFVLPAPGRRYTMPVGFGAALAAMLYTHNWALFFGIASGATWLLLLRLADPLARRPLLRNGLVAYGTTALLYLPWLPSLAFQVIHTGAPWAKAPTFDGLVAVPARLLGGEAPEVALILAAGAGMATVLKVRDGRRLTPEGRALLALLTMALLTILLA